MLNHTAGEHWRCVALLCSTLNRPFTSECSKTTLVLSLKKCVFSSIKAPAPGMNICPKYVGAFNRLVLRLSWLSVKSVITVALLQCLFSYCVHVMFRYSNFHNSFIGNNSIYEMCVCTKHWCAALKILDIMKLFVPPLPVAQHKTYLRLDLPISHISITFHSGVCSVYIFSIHIQDNESIYCSPMLIKNILD